MQVESVAGGVGETAEIAFEVEIAFELGSVVVAVVVGRWRNSVMMQIERVDRLRPQS